MLEITRYFPLKARMREGLKVWTANMLYIYNFYTIYAGSESQWYTNVVAMTMFKKYLIL